MSWFQKNIGSLDIIEKVKLVKICIRTFNIAWKKLKTIVISRFFLYLPFIYPTLVYSFVFV